MDGKEKDEKNVVVAKTPAELQKMRLDKLMKNPSKEVFIPESSQERKPRDPLEFIRNVWGSSAGAGSGDFHVYRGVRRREYARQKYVDEKFERDNADAEYQKKLEKNQTEAEIRTAKKRAKRLKKKQKQKGKKPKKEQEEKEESDEESEDEETEESREQDCDKGHNSNQNGDMGHNSNQNGDMGYNSEENCDTEVKSEKSENHNDNKRKGYRSNKQHALVDEKQFQISANTNGS
ncbi:PRKR-interacting protein 1 homolog,PRKR-interacting protein 1 [Mytilus edulis]|uniref:PRKR-interacting protein 1 homolog,PRKR-interacting protein 1 n=1 Tax=Mytilus edulis TaxID=6550 RepID=A0A8S3S071_MYTED|nr:PRKR-interacting protein 1 homolog,PRKR-interacting protein 1 [Mytilus edulis]